MRFETILTAALNSKPSAEQLAEWAKRPAYQHDTPAPKNALTGGDGRTLDPENVQYAAEYAEPGYSDPKTGILFADWNACSRRVQSLLEAAGYELEWEDEWYICECGKAFRTSPDSYSWLPSYVELSGELLCHECASSADYLESIEDNPSRALTLDIDPADYGYVMLEEGFESGFHPGQTDNPLKIFTALRKKGYQHIIFRVDSKGQFDLGFSVWHKPES
jgi:hypothetical protein